MNKNVYERIRTDKNGYEYGYERIRMDKDG